ncbi:hypothetical protein J5TS2_00240 [Brevibacillus halotolerans]|nr:hypothetical protein J5TS2_00240 [Brevibacillus halotolerans]
MPAFSDIDTVSKKGEDNSASNERYSETSTIRYANVPDPRTSN